MVLETDFAAGDPFFWEVISAYCVTNYILVFDYKQGVFA